MKNRGQVSAPRLAGAMTLAFFILQAAFMGALLAHVPNAAQALGLSGLYTLVYGGFLAAYVRMEKPEAKQLAFVGAFAAAAMLSRAAMLDFVTADYRAFLSGWIEAFRQGGAKMLAVSIRWRKMWAITT